MIVGAIVWPSEGKRGMDLGRALTYMFQDPQWVKKALIAIVMLIIPIIGWLIFYGYLLRIMRQTALGSDVPLPEWDDFGGDFVRGIKGFIINLVWNIPVLILALCGQIGALLGTVAGANRETEVIQSLVTLCTNCLSWLASIALAFISPVFITRFAVTGEMAAAFALPQIFREIRSSATDLLIVFLISMVLGLAALFGVILCLVGVIATFLYAWWVQAQLYGQVRRRLAAGGESAATPSPVTPIV